MSESGKYLLSGGAASLFRTECTALGMSPLPLNVSGYGRPYEPWQIIDTGRLGVESENLTDL